MWGEVVLGSVSPLLGDWVKSRTVEVCGLLLPLENGVHRTPGWQECQNSVTALRKVVKRFGWPAQGQVAISGPVVAALDPMCSNIGLRSDVNLCKGGESGHRPAGPKVQP